MTRPRSPHYRQLRLERSEDRRLLSATQVTTPDVSADDTQTYLPIYTSGFVEIDAESTLPTFDFAGGNATVSDTISFADLNVSHSNVITRGTLNATTLNATTESFRGDATNVLLSFDSSADRAGLTLSWGGGQQGIEATTLLQVGIAGRVVAIDTALVDAVLSTMPERELATDGQKSAIVDLVQRWFSENEAYLNNSSPNTDGWIPEGNDTYLGDSEGASDSELGSWSDPEATTGPATPSLDNAFTRGDGVYDGDFNGGTTYHFSQGADELGSGSRLLSKLREWLRDETELAASNNLESQKARARTSAIPLERVAETPAPDAGEEAPGAGMIDLAALLLPAADSDEAPSVALAAATLPADADGVALAHDAALAVESWVRTLPVPTEAIGVVDGMAPPIESPAVGVRKDLPVKQATPQPQAAKDHVSAAASEPSAEARQTLARGSERPAERLDEQQATSGPGYVAAWLTTLLGGAVVWANRRGGRNRASDCIETPRRETGRIA